MDFNLQMRFWRSVTDAMLHSADAAFAAAAAWQDEVLSSDKKPQSFAFEVPAAANPWPWLQVGQAWMSAAAMPVQTPQMPMPFAFFSMMPYSMMPQVADFWRTFGSPMAFAGRNPFWPWPMAWATMQLPLTAMMVSAGVPYAVASPSAKASTAAMEAADAARQQIEKVYSAYRSDGGHAAQLVAFPLTMAASFLSCEPQKTNAFGW